MLRNHFFEPKTISINNNVFSDRNVQIRMLDKIEIYSSKISALLNRLASRDLFDIYILSQNDIFNKDDKILLKKCFLFNYIAICGYDIENLNLKVLDKITQNDIYTKLIPTLKDRNFKNNDVAVMKEKVRIYLNEIVKLNDKELLFYNNFKNGIYTPELLFEDTEILNKIKNHPMVIWKLQQNK
jgi:predicted nucleotidyltransferase component of viral defense system